ncbi:unnamed protein product [Linum trigynum]|uniref:Reverse transcriptase domain-containing protein n=1 Tax=Linum trigynum TaxID=586398 RepID=A0AAV2CA97_9ROSI
MLISSISGRRNSEWAAKDAIETCGGIAIFWDKGIFSLVDKWEGKFSLAVKLQRVGQQETFAILGVYGPQDKENKLAFLEELRMVCEGCLDPLCIIGDFNLVRCEDDYRGLPRDRELMEKFNELISKQNLIDLPLKGSLFTWSRGGSNGSLSRIDRALVNPWFDSCFAPESVLALDRVESDHNPLLLRWGSEEKISRPWKFLNVWLLEESFLTSLVGWWNLPTTGFGCLYLFGKRLRNTKFMVKGWNIEKFGRTDEKVSRLLFKLKEIDKLEEQGPLADSLLIERTLLKCELEKTLLKEEIIWRQKSREIWLKVGDLNTSYFHRVAQNNLRRNKIQNIKVNGVWVDTKEDLQSAFRDHFQGRFLEEKQARPFPKGYRTGLIDAEENYRLSVPFTEAEIWKAISECDGDRAPGPDGFTLEFYKKGWNVIKRDLVKALDEFHISGFMPDSIAHSFLCLIPKKDAAEEVSDFRPISLVGSLNKVLSKVLIARLRPLMDRIVTRHQFAGVRGRQLHEASLIANELVDSRKRSGKPGVILKLDIEKAFDSVNWGCLLSAAASMGFSSKIQRWIKGIVSSTRLSVLVNGESTGYFKTERGLKQGDPLSPFFFNIAMDILSFMIQEACSEGFIKGFCMDEVNRRGEVTHLLYADDAIIYCDATEEEVRNILAILVCFQSVSGLKVNLEKSRMFPVGDVDSLGRLAEVFGCDWSFLPTTYLGLPLGAPPAAAGVWNTVITRLQTKMEGWKGSLLSLGGRIVLSNACLASQPLFRCSLFIAPKGVIQRIENIQRDFIWSGLGEQKKIHLVAWERCKIPKKWGGLGIKDLELQNKALICKWLWRFAREQDNWWRELIQIKFAIGATSWKSGGIQGAVRISLWKQITTVNAEFWKFARVKIGMGNNILFWLDHWLNERTLAEIFPRVAAAAAFPLASVSQCLHFENESLTWEIPLKYTLRGGAERERVSLLNYLNSLVPSLFPSAPAGSDSLMWRAPNTASFTVSSMYQRFIKEKCQPREDFPFKTIWQGHIPTKVCTFMWVVHQKKILTHVSLKKRGWSFPSKCVLCGVAEEDANHLFLTCSFTCRVWEVLQAFVCITNAPPDISQAIQHWPKCKPANPKEWCTKSLLHALCWSVWRERNARTFDGKATPELTVAFKTGSLIAHWLLAADKVEKVIAESWLEVLKSRTCGGRGTTWL